MPKHLCTHFSASWSRRELHKGNHYGWWDVGLQVWYKNKAAIFTVEVKIIIKKKHKTADWMWKIMLLFFNCRDLMCYEFVPRGPTVNQ